MLFDKPEKNNNSALYYDEGKVIRDGHMALLPFLNTLGSEMADFRYADSG